MKRYGRPEIIVTDRLRSYRATMREIGNEARQLYNRENFKIDRSTALAEWRQLAA